VERPVIAAGALAGRTLAVGGIFALAVILELQGASPYSIRVLTALPALALMGFGSTLAYALIARQPGVRWLEPIQAIGDLLLITALVYCTGGTQSLFGFLYVGWIAYVASRVGPVGALAAGGLSTVAYAVMAVALARGWVSPLDAGHPGTIQSAIFSIGRHALAFLTTALLCSHLAREIRTGRSQLRELSEIHRKIVDHVSSGLLTVDREGRVTFLNREAERICGWAEGEALGTPVQQVLPNLTPSLPETVDGSIEGEGPGGPVTRNRQTLRVAVRGNRTLVLGYSSSPLLGERGEPDGYVVIFQDLTHVIDMEERLRRSGKLAAVGQLAAGLAHEIRNPLASLSGAIELLECESPPELKSSRRLFEIAQREARRLNALLSDFLEFARPKTPIAVTVQLGLILEEVRDLLARGEPGTGRIEVDVPDGIRVVGDPDQLRQVFWNLLLNGIQAQSEDGSVTVRARSRADPPDPSDTWVEVAVEDRGQGIAPEVLSRVFDPFFTTKPKGTGLGLATVHRIVEAHGGSVQIATEIGRGTCVRVFLRAAS
jgi:two-component system sensor histidine kinase PilS (NtrC family)